MRTQSGNVCGSALPWGWRRRACCDTLRPHVPAGPSTVSAVLCTSVCQKVVCIAVPTTKECCDAGDTYWQSPLQSRCQPKLGAGGGPPARTCMHACKCITAPSWMLAIHIRSIKKLKGTPWCNRLWCTAVGFSQGGTTGGVRQLLERHRLRVPAPARPRMPDSFVLHSHQTAGVLTQPTDGNCCGGRLPDGRPAAALGLGRRHARRERRHAPWACVAGTTCGPLHSCSFGRVCNVSGALWPLRRGSSGDKAREAA